MSASLTSLYTMMTAGLLATSSSPSASREEPVAGQIMRPAEITSVEMEAFVRSAWPYFSSLIRTHDALEIEPKRVISVPHILCALGYDGRFFECATLVIYELSGGQSRSSLVRHDVERDSEGRLNTAIVIRERPLPK